MYEFLQDIELNNVDLLIVANCIRLVALTTVILFYYNIKSKYKANIC